MRELQKNTFCVKIKHMPAIEQLFNTINKNPYLAVPLMIWAIIWKGLALWKAAEKKDKIWFAALLVLNTLGLTEIAYYFIFSQKPIFPRKIATN